MSRRRRRARIKQLNVADFGLLDGTAVTMALGFDIERYYNADVKFTHNPLDFCTFARNSDAWYIAADGSLVKAVAGEMRKDDYSTGVKGLLKEPSSSITMNNMMAGGGAGVWPTGMNSNGTQGGITRTIVGVGIEDGWPYLELRFAGTPTNTTSTLILFNNPGNNPGITGETFTLSGGAKIVGGDLTGIPSTGIRFRIEENNSSLGYMAQNSTAFTPTTTRDRYSHTRTLTEALTVYVRGQLSVQGTVGTPIDITLRIYAPQLEKGAVATSPILSDSSTVTKTRSADDLRIDGAAFAAFYNQTEGTFVMDATVLGHTTSTDYPQMFSVEGSSYQNRVTLLVNKTFTPDQFSIDMYSGGVFQGIGSYGGISLDTLPVRTKSAVGIKTNNSRAAFDGNLATLGTACTVPNIMTQLLIGAKNMNMVVHSLKYHPNRSTDASLAGVTTP